MPSQNTSVSTGEVILAVFVSTAVLFLMIGFQTIQILRDRGALDQVMTQQDKPLEDARKVQQQFTALALGTKKLADGGDKAAGEIVARIEQMGLKFGDQNQGQGQNPANAPNAPAPPAPGSVQSMQPPPHMAPASPPPPNAGPAPGHTPPPMP